MKSILITAAVSLVIGFAGGWMIKSASTDLETITSRQIQRPERPKPAPKPDRASEAGDRPQRPEPQDKPLKYSPIAGGNAEIPESAKQADRAKWSRLIEVLGLSADQAKDLQENIEKTTLNPSEDEDADLVYDKAGEDLQKRLLALLSPEQQEAFREFQERSIENKIEVKTNEAYATDLGDLDLTPAQREQAIELLRAEAEAEVGSIPASTRLLLEGSILPIGNSKFSEESVMLLRTIRNQAGADPSVVGIEEITAMNRAKIESKIKSYEEILSPAQLERYQAKISESLEALEMILPPN